MTTKKTLLAALLLTAGTAFAYEDVTDLTGATEPPKGPADDSFVGDIRPGNAGGSGERAAEPDTTSAGTESQTSGQQQASGSQGAVGAGDQASLFQELDADRDGNVSEYEVRNHNQLIESFSDVDEDNDGVLSADELDTWQGFEREAER